MGKGSAIGHQSSQPPVKYQVLIAGHNGYILSDTWAKETVAMASIEGVLLDIDGTMCGRVSSAQGGGGIATVVQEPFLDQPKKHLEQLGWEDLELEFSLPLHRTVSEWITAWLRRQAKPRTVRLTAYDTAFNVIRQREFRGASITETTVPALDAGSSGPALLKLKLRPEFMRPMLPRGTVPAPSLLKPLLAANFRLDLPGLDCTKVTKIDSFTVTQPPVQAAWGVGGELAAPEAGPLSFPNLTVTLLESSAATWQAWFDAFVVKGYNDDSQEKTGRLALLDPALREHVGIDLFNVGIFRLTPSPWTRQAYPVVVAGLYCERMDFTVLP